MYYQIRIRYYKWYDNDNTYCGRVVGKTANYYKNGEVYALYQEWILRDSDIEISENEFKKLINL